MPHSGAQSRVELCRRPYPWAGGGTLIHSFFGPYIRVKCPLGNGFAGCCRHSVQLVCVCVCICERCFKWLEVFCRFCALKDYPLSTPYIHHSIVCHKQEKCYCFQAILQFKHSFVHSFLAYVSSFYSQFHR